MNIDRIHRQHLLQRLDTRRHLPPGTWLPQPETAEERQLLAGLLSLPFDRDPIQWLREEHGRLIARIAVRDLLADVQQHVHGLQQAAHYGWIEEPIEPVWLGALVQLPEGAMPIIAVEHSDMPTILPSPEVLRQVLATLRSAVNTQLPQDGTTAPQDGSRLNVLAQLLSLPESEDPLEWLRHERGTFAAELVLDRVLASSQPPQTAGVGPAVHIVRPRAEIQPSDRVRVRIQEVIFGAGATRIIMQVRINRRGLQRSRAEHTAISWRGFTEAADDLGNTYVMQACEQGDTTDYPWWTSYTLNQEFYPAPTHDVKELIFRAGPESLIVRHVRLPSHNQAKVEAGEPEYTGKEVTWHVTVPHR